MPRISGTNTFEGGMIKDFNSIVVPKNVMTDCLNGTLITYNGNEFALQNDMGNYKFKEGKLSEGFVPVGMKEYGGILYIISYNPTNDEVEVGSFPSQRTIFHAVEEGFEGKTINPIKLDQTYSIYSKLIESSNITVLSTEDDCFLNPGDEYKFTEVDNDTYYYQHLHPYILTDDNKLFDIHSYIDVKTTEDFQKVKWEIPGYLALQWAINVMDEFDVFFEEGDLKVSNVSGTEYTVTPSGKLKIQSFWNTRIYNEKTINYIKSNLVYIFNNGPSDEGIWSEDNDDYYIIDPKDPEKNEYLNFNSQQISIYYNTEDNDNFKYIAPALKCTVKKDDKEVIKYLIYDQFNTQISRQEESFEASNLSVAVDTFKYIVSDDSITLNFDVNSYPGVKLQYQLVRNVDNCQYSINKNDQYSYVKNEQYAISYNETELDVYSDWKTFENLNYSGNNIYDLYFTTKSEYESIKYKLDEPDEPEYKYYEGTIKNENSFYDYNLNEEKEFATNKIFIANTFDKEDKYTIKFRFKVGNIILEESGNEKPLLATEVVNSLYYTKNNFENLTFNDLEPYVPDYIKINQTLKDNSFTNELRWPNGEVTKSLDKKKEIDDLIDGLRNEDGTLNTDKTTKLLDLNICNGAFDVIKKTSVLDFVTTYTLGNVNDFIITYPLNQYKTRGFIWRVSELNITNAEFTTSSNVKTYSFIESDGSIKYSVKDTHTFTPENTVKSQRIPTKWRPLFGTTKEDNSYTVVTAEGNPGWNEPYESITINGGFYLEKESDSRQKWTCGYYRPKSKNWPKTFKFINKTIFVEKGNELIPFDSDDFEIYYNRHDSYYRDYRYPPLENDTLLALRSTNTGKYTADITREANIKIKTPQLGCIVENRQYGGKTSVTRVTFMEGAITSASNQELSPYDHSHYSSTLPCILFHGDNDHTVAVLPYRSNGDVTPEVYWKAVLRSYIYLLWYCRGVISSEVKNAYYFDRLYHERSNQQYQIKSIIYTGNIINSMYFNSSFDFDCITSTNLSLIPKIAEDISVLIDSIPSYYNGITPPDINMQERDIYIISEYEDNWRVDLDSLTKEYLKCDVASNSIIYVPKAEDEIKVKPNKNNKLMISELHLKDLTNPSVWT